MFYFVLLQGCCWCHQSKYRQAWCDAWVCIWSPGDSRVLQEPGGLWRDCRSPGHQVCDLCHVRVQNCRGSKPVLQRKQGRATGPGACYDGPHLPSLWKSRTRVYWSMCKLLGNPRGMQAWSSHCRSAPRWTQVQTGWPVQLRRDVSAKGSSAATTAPQGRRKKQIICWHPPPVTKKPGFSGHFYKNKVFFSTSEKYIYECLNKKERKERGLPSPP